MEEEKEARNVGIIMNALQTTRNWMASMLGQSTFEGKRDTYKTFGYPKTVEFENLYNHYDRDEMGGTLCEFIPSETWRNDPILIDGDARSDGEDNLTPFLSDWKAIEKRLKIISMLTTADIYNGFSRYAVIFIGAPGNFEQPLTRVPNGNAIAYLSVHHEGTAKIHLKEKNQRDPRYGLPVMYKIKFDDDGREVPVHWTRCIHIKEGNAGSRIHGRPRLRRLFNRLLDWEKVVGGSSEAFYQLINAGIAYIADEDASLPQPGSAEEDKLMEKIELFTHQMQRQILLEGVTPKQLTTQVVSGKEQADTIAGALGMGSRTPKRILMGSEMGQLASTQDDKNWADVISSRQTKIVEDSILRPTIDRFVGLNAIPAPTSGIENYGVEWASLFEPTDDEKATLSNKVLNMLSQLTGGLVEDYVDPIEFLTVFFPRAVSVYKELATPPVEDDEDDNKDEEDDDSPNA